MDRHTIILKKRLKEIIEHNEKCKFYIFPFGEAGIIDNKLGKVYPERIYTLNAFKNVELYGAVVLLISYRDDIHAELVHQLVKTILNVKYIDVFDEYEKSVDMENEERVCVYDEMCWAMNKIEDGRFNKYMCYHPNRTNSIFYLPFVITDLIQRTIFLSDDYYERKTLDFVFDEFKREKLIRTRCEGGTFIDAGANIGNHSLYFAKEIHAGKVFSFEPVRETYDILKKNIILNNLEQIVETYNYGLCSTPGRAYRKDYDLRILAVLVLSRLK